MHVATRIQVIIRYFMPMHFFQTKQSILLASLRDLVIHTCRYMVRCGYIGYFSFLACVCTVTNFSADAEEKLAASIKFCTAVHRRFIGVQGRE